MSEHQTTPKSAEERFWDKFVARARENGVKEQAIRWHLYHARTYLKAFPDQRLAHQTSKQVTGYLEQTGRLDRIPDWQFVQIVDAIQNLFLTARAPVAKEVDWEFWRMSARQLEPSHPTIAREGQSSSQQEQETTPFPSVRLKQKSTALDQVRQRHQALLERLIAEIRRRQYSIRTEQSYEAWICRFILFCNDQDPTELGADQIQAFLTDLAVRGQVAASTQNQALNALVFLYKQVLGRSLEELGAFSRAKRPKRLPVVLDRAEVARLLAGIEGMHYLMAALLYGTGMRLMECVRLRVQDIDFQYHQIVVRDGKVYTHVLNRGGQGVCSPLDGLMS